MGIIYHIEFAKTGFGMSGGETCMVENIKYFLSKGIKQVILTTNNGKIVYEKLGLKENDLLEYKIINSFSDEKKYHIFIAYLKRLKKIKRLIKDIIINDDDIILCHSDFFPNSISMYWLSKKNKNSKLFYFFHMLAPNILKGYEGEFINKFSLPNLGIIHYKLNQLLYIKIIKKINRGILIGVNPYYEKYLSKFFSKRNIKLYFLKIFGGVNIDKNFINQDKKYDGVWMGRFHKQKGINELFDIVKKLKEKKENIKIVVIGGGDEKVENEFREKIKINNLEKNIIYKGFINGEERFKIISQAKIFLMTSYFEGRPIVMIEMMSLGIPIVSYNLPIYGVYNKGVIKVPILNNIEFSNKILNLLENNDLYEKYKKEAIDFSSNYSWKKTGEEIYNLIK